MNAFPDGARVAFLGDSLVAANQTLAHIIAHYRRHLPERDVRFFNCGISGGSAASMLLYLEEDTLPWQPTHAVIALGVNDSRRDLLALPQSPDRYAKLLEAYEKHCAAYRALCRALTERGIAVTLCTPAPYAEYQPEGNEPLRGGYALMAGYADFCRRLAAEMGLPLCDYHDYLTRRLQEESFYGADRIHPNAHGYWHIARCFLAWQGMDIGEEQPIPADMQPWHETVCRYRRIWGGEWMIVGAARHALPLAEKLRHVESYLETQEREVMRGFARAYLADKPVADELRAAVGKR